MKVCSVTLTNNAIKDLSKVPFFVRNKLIFWISAVERIGIHEVRKRAGLHDEPLRGNRKGYRSIRLNKAYRAIYKEDSNRKLHIIWIMEVNKHAY